MFGFSGPQELMVILLIILVIFGGKKIPELMGGLGKGVRSFKKGLDTEEVADESGEEGEAKSEAIHVRTYVLAPPSATEIRSTEAHSSRLARMDSNHQSPACHAGVFALGPRDHRVTRVGVEPTKSQVLGLLALPVCVPSRQVAGPGIEPGAPAV